jgi:DNA-binding MarR family transcriptional regulator
MPKERDPAALPHTAERLHSLAVRLVRRARIADRDAGVGPAQLSALSVLYFAEGMSLTALAEAEQVAQPTMTRIVNALVEGKLVRRIPSPADRRMQLIVITAAGRRLFGAARARRLGIVEGILGRLDAQSLATLAPLVEEVLAVVNAPE